MKALRLTVLVASIALMAASAARAQTRVVDGDTIDLDGLMIRIHGIDAPEYGQECGAWHCGRAALDRLSELVSDGKPVCVPLEQDRYGRTIARCTVNGRDIGRSLVAEGFAWAFVRYSDNYVDDEASARASGIGIWNGEHEAPWDYRARKWNQAARAAPEGCAIKGNISAGGKIYHPPWSPWYEKTRINVSKGERWFCSEDEAIAAGWRAPVWR